MVAPELKQNTDIDTEITKTCAVLGCEDSKNLEPESFFRYKPSNSIYVYLPLFLSEMHNRYCLPKLQGCIYM